MTTFSIEADERGFVLHAESESFRIDDGMEFYEMVRREMGEWYADYAAAKRESVRGTVDGDTLYWKDREGVKHSGPFRCSPEDVDESAGLREIVVGHQTVEGYYADDPKHPDYHSVHVDHYDNREGK